MTATAGTLAASPRSLEEVVSCLEAEPGATILAGGTDLMVEVNAGKRQLGPVISLRRVRERCGWRRQGDAVVLGACLTFAQAETGDLAELVPALAQAARTVGSPQIRSAATLGGNLGTATAPLDERGQGNAHVAFAFAAHRAVVDVDLDLGLVRVVEIATSQDVGRVLNPIQVVGQIEGGIAQGVGLAVMEEVLVANGVVRNASFTDYLIPTALDMPEVSIAALIEQPEPGAPFGAKGVGEAPTVSSSAAVAAAIRDATGLDLTRIPIKPEDIVRGQQKGREGEVWCTS